MNILEQIVNYKKEEIRERKILVPASLLEKSKLFTRRSVSLRKYILHIDRSGVIAEFKRRSPSKGIINDKVSVEHTTKGYVDAGVSALSVLTDTEFFGGANEDLITARNFNSCPILRKDFIIDEYQIIEAKAIGADAILLIAAVLPPEKLNQLAVFAHELELEVLMEVHNREELQSHLVDSVDLIGINNRNLKTFEVDINTSLSLSKMISRQFVLVSESGINNPESVVTLKKAGFQGFLIGEYFMAQDNPGEACAEFIKSIRLLEEGK